MCRNHEYKLSLKGYIKEKLRMLQKDFMIGLNEAQISHMKSLKSEIDVDHYAYDLIMNRK